MCNYMYSLGRTPLAQDGKGLGGGEGERKTCLFYSILQNKVGSATSGMETLRGTDFLLDGVTEAVSDCSKVLSHYMVQ